MSGSIVSADLVIEGEIKCEGDLSVDGKVMGNINCKNSIVNTVEFVQGDIHVVCLSSFGIISGNIQAKSVELKEVSNTKSNLQSAGLEVSSGASISGTINIGRKAEPAE